MKKIQFTYRHTVVASYFGYITQSIVNNLAPLLFIIFRDTYGLPLSRITLLVTFNFLIQLFVDYISAGFIDRAGYKKSIVCAHIACALGLVSMAVLPSVMTHKFASLIISVVLYAVGGGIIEVLISPIVEACPSDNKAGSMSLLHSFYCWGTVAVVALSTLFLYVFGKENWKILTVLWAAIPVMNAVFFTKVPVNTLTEKDEGMTKRELLKTKLFWLFIILMIASGASEQAMSQWASAFAESGLGVPKVTGDLIGPCMFSVLMGISRVITAKVSAKTGTENIMTASGILCIISYLIATLSPDSILSLAGCALCGFSVGAMWPSSFSLASSRFRKGGTSMFALLALAGDLGCMSGPTFAGEIASLAGDNLKTGFLFSIIFPVLLIVSVFILKKSENRA